MPKDKQKFSAPKTGNRNIVSTLIIAAAIITPLLNFSAARASLAQVPVMRLHVFEYDGENVDLQDGLNFGLDIYATIYQQDNRVYFSIYNNSSVKSSVAGIYFEDGFFDGISGFDLGPGTSFCKDARPKNLPAGNNLDPDFLTAFSAGAKSPSPYKGINGGEYATVILNIDDGKTFEQLQSQLFDGTVRVGAHVISLPKCASASGIFIPEPATLVLIGISCIFLVPSRKRRWSSKI